MRAVDTSERLSPFGYGRRDRPPLINATTSWKSSTTTSIRAFAKIMPVSRRIFRALTKGVKSSIVPRYENCEARSMK